MAESESLLFLLEELEGQAMEDTAAMPVIDLYTVKTHYHTIMVMEPTFIHLMDLDMVDATNCDLFINLFIFCRAKKRQLKVETKK